MKSLWIGMSHSGKEEVLQKIFPNTVVSSMPQSLMHYGHAIDSPAEYMENPFCFSSLLVTSYDVELVVLVHRASQSYNPYPYNFAIAFNRKTIGVIVDDTEQSKEAICEEPFKQKCKDQVGSEAMTVSTSWVKRAESYLLYAGAEEVYVDVDEFTRRYNIG